ncbi:MAG: hypothetical protein R3D98_05505 [Candidatus Krumholzibacteriia bacterium]
MILLRGSVGGCRCDCRLAPAHLFRYIFALLPSQPTLLALCVLLTGPKIAQPDTFEDPLLGHLVGTWLTTGTIAGGAVVRDVVARWVLAQQYLQIHEVARELAARGAPACETIISIGWDEPTQRYTCLWLDVTGAGDLDGDWIGHATRQDDPQHLRVSRRQRHLAPAHRQRARGRPV